MNCWMIYGANGYTGELIAREAVRLGLKPVLAGRRRRAIEALANQLGLESRVFDLQQIEPSRHLQGIRVVAHCAGPFSSTSQPMIDACLSARAHYLDITGEISVFVAAQARHAEAVEAGVVLCPGVGFDVIPTDCLAAVLKEAMPDADRLALGFDSKSGFSPGTAKTSIEGLREGGRIREDGKIRSVPLAYQCRDIDFGNGTRHAASIPWGDIATAWFSTGIPNIEVFVPMAPSAAVRLRRINWVRPLLALPLVQNILMKQVSRRIRGPNQTQRQDAPTYVWGEAQNPVGRKLTARVRTANGYDVTVQGVLLAVSHLCDASTPAPGYYTPSQLLGPRCIERLPGSGTITLS
ncbi:saccharopine dehydrogenase family protein [Pseudomonas sp.]|jgi:short subunit dehydrogenase-like uncharacterized protein|uniref:saccharopine dehydrogenase family protein n=1 Tax=Pseudomonas sp. TaxID=306 RepID=UPI002729E89F|nr:saccharopine dehydrogenase NADP-binding domain-containing protein [Pseudomonas sp.]